MRAPKVGVRDGPRARVPRPCDAVRPRPALRRRARGTRPQRSRCPPSRALPPTAPAIASPWATADPMRTANRTVPSPTVPPRSQPTTRTTSSMPEPHPTDGPPCAQVDPRHPAVARPGSEVGGQVEPATQTDEADPEQDEGELGGPLIRSGDEGHTHLQRHRDHDCVGDRAEPRPLAQRDPQQEDQCAHQEGRHADRHGQDRGQSLGQNGPGAHAESPLDDEGLAGPERIEADQQDHQAARGR